MSRRWRYPRTRRGEFYPFIPTAASTPPGIIPGFQEPSGRNSRLAAMRVRRGRFPAVVRSAPYPPPGSSRRVTVRLTTQRRGKFYPVPAAAALPLATPWVPALVEARRAAAQAPRRGRFWALPVAPQYCPARVISRRPCSLRSRRGQIWQAPFQALVPAGPGPYIPRTISAAHKPPPRPTRRGRFIEPFWVVTPPMAGTAHAAVGTAASASAGSTSAPSAAAAVMTVPTATGG